MGAWSINDDATDEMWGDEESDILGEYLDYLADNDPQRLQNREQLIEDTSVLIWYCLYDVEYGRAATRAEIEYGIDFVWEDEKYGNLLLPEPGKDTPPITDKEIFDNISFDPEYGSVKAYLSYLRETNPERLNDRETLLNDTWLLVWEIFHNLKGRKATRAELDRILTLSS